ncbi:HEAT repeat domain-containing protein [Salinispora pacifica]|uniref:HEAT repeat domain-containing protein n=1 Tax=Salinispora pacifica TaxID=351187 RepID=UPI001E57147D|nr:HEAT repeat domain-containing protein [Salinispora pacifica]
MTKRFERAMWLMHRHDPQAMEDGFGLLLPHAADHLDELIAEFAQERNGHGLRCWLLELIGEARSSQALPLLTEQLYSDDESFRSWAVIGLKRLNTKQARRELWKARCNGLND